MERRDRVELEWLHLTPRWIGLSLGGSVQRINVQYFYRLATVLRPLSRIQSGMSVEEVFSDLFAAEGELSFFLWNTLMPPDTSFSMGYELLEAIKALTSEVGKNKVLTPLEANQITNGLTKFETVMQADYGRRDTFVPSKKGILSLSDLIDSAESMFAKEIQERIPHATKDMHEAGRCIAFELPTAAGFHIFRAVEAVGREYVTIVRGTSPTDKEKNLGLGAYKRILEEHGADPRVINALDQLRKLHRNPTMHPEVTLTTQEVITTLGMAQSAIQAMVADMEKFRMSPEQAVAQMLPNVEVEETESKPAEAKKAAGK